MEIIDNTLIEFFKWTRDKAEYLAGKSAEQAIAEFKREQKIREEAQAGEEPKKNE